MNDQDLIRGYFNDSLSESERISFEKKYNQENEFRKLADDMELEILAFRSLEREQTRTKFAQWENEVTSTKSITWKSWKVWSAAAVLILVGTLTFRLYTNSVDLYQEYYNTYENFEVTALRNQSNELTIREKAYFLYDQKSYEEAISTFNQIVSPAESDHFFIAMCHMELGQWEQSEKILTQIHQLDFSYQQAAKWYLALVYLQLDQVDDCINMLQSLKEGEFSDQAQQLLKELSN